MTLPRADRRSTVAERRQQREQFKLLKEEQRAARRPINRWSDYRAKVRAKLANLSKRTSSLAPFSGKMLSVLKAAEWEMVDAYAKARLLRLTEQERLNLRRNLCLLVALPNDADFKALCAYQNGQAG
jgi:hypothetical protein